MLFALSAVVDVVLVAFLVTHTSGSVSDLALIGGGIVALWGVLHSGRIGDLISRGHASTSITPRARDRGTRSTANR